MTSCDYAALGQVVTTLHSAAVLNTGTFLDGDSVLLQTHTACCWSCFWKSKLSLVPQLMLLLWWEEKSETLGHSGYFLSAVLGGAGMLLACLLIVFGFPFHIGLLFSWDVMLQGGFFASQSDSNSLQFSRIKSVVFLVLILILVLRIKAFVWSLFHLSEPFTGRFPLYSCSWP